MTLWIGENLTVNTNIESLKANQNIKYYFLNDQQHNNDDDIPAFKFEYFNPLNSPTDLVGLMSVSHCKEPFTFKFENDKIKHIFDFKGDKFMVSTPIGYDECDNLGVFQGLTLIKFKSKATP